VSRRPTAVVIGAGVTGLAAAFALADSEGARVVVLDSSWRAGGKIATEPFAGVPLDLGPDSFLARVPHAVDLCGRLGLGDELIAPATGKAWLWVRGRLRPLPEGLVLGVPSNLAAVARSGILSPAGVARAALDLVLPRPAAEGDRSVGDVVAGRFGAEVHRRLVDPLLGGIHAGRSELLSVAATAPQLDAAARRGRSLLLALRRAAPPPTPGGAVPPVFLSHPAGLERVVDALTGRLAAAGVELALGEAATSVERGAGPGWAVRTDRRRIDADAVIVCVPAPATAGLLDGVAPRAGAFARSVEHSSVVVTALAYRASDVPARLDGSGFLVPRTEGRLLTAGTWTSSKWPHLAPAGLVLVRASAGRYGDERALQLDDTELVGALHAELAEAMGLSGPPVEHRVTRWPGAFPQYTVGHLDRVAAAEAELAGLPGLEAAGAAFRGLGIPACIAQGEAAAARALDHLRSLAPTR